MKKRVLILAVGIMVALSLTACGKVGQDRTEDESVIEESDDESEVEAESEDVTEDKETDKADTDEQNKDTSEVISEAEPENDEEALHGPVDVDPVVASAPISEGYCQVDDLVYQPYITFAEFISLFEKSRLSKWIEMVYDPNQEVRDGQAYRIRCPKIGENEAFCEIIVDVINPTTDDDDILNINDCLVRDVIVDGDLYKSVLAGDSPFVMPGGVRIGVEGQTAAELVDACINAGYVKRDFFHYRGMKHESYSVFSVDDRSDIPLEMTIGWAMEEVLDGTDRKGTISFLCAFDKETGLKRLDWDHKLSGETVPLDQIEHDRPVWEK